MSENIQARLIEILTPLVSPMGYEIVYLEVQLNRQKVLRLFIDHQGETTGIGIDDCVKVTKALDEPLEGLKEVDAAFGGNPYELEVSSPGIDRPLRTEKDFIRFAGKEVRIHVFRPLTSSELGNEDYQSRNPKQKNFLGTLRGLDNGKVLIAVNLTGGHDKAGVKKKSKSKQTNSVEEGPLAAAKANWVTIPLPLISKANLEPDFEGLDQ